MCAPLSICFPCLLLFAVRLVSFSQSLHSELHNHLEVIQVSLRSYRKYLDEALGKLRDSNVNFLKACRYRDFIGALFINSYLFLGISVCCMGRTVKLKFIFLFIESQNHRMLGVGRDLCGSSGPTPLPKQGHLQQAAQDLVQAGLEYLQRRRSI